MPTLNWIGKDAVVKHHNDVPYRLLEPVPALSLPSPTGKEAEGEPDIDPYQGNLIVQGDNLQALKALLPHYGGKVKCIYIDPPYNTGNEGWAYNDNVNSPEIRRWLGEVVGKEGDTLDRHDRWLCMMYPRLMLLRQFLRDDGAIFVSIDDNEVASLRLLMDEIFGSGNFIANFIWEKRKNRENRKAISIRHDHVIAYAKRLESTTKNFKPLPMNTDALSRYNNREDDDPRGPWKSDPATAQAGHGTKSQFYTLTSPNGKKHEPPSGRCWVYTEVVMNEAIADNRIWFGKSGNNVPRIKTFLNEKNRGLTPETILFAKDASTNEEAKNNLKEIFSGQSLFETPKPIELIQQFLRMCTANDDIVIDSFAGSGASAHAVLKQNAEDGGNRRFILVEMDEGIARNVTSERVRRVAQGYTNAKDQAVEGLGGSFHFCRLGQQLFDARGHIDPNVRFGDLARFVWFQETGQPLSAPGRKGWSPLLGVHRGRAVYLLYNGVLKDRAIDGGNVLTSPLLAELPAHDGPRVVYGARCVIGADRLRRLDITFKQLPYDLRVSR
jgi:adenine-specific DNA-methyltransferase